MKEKLTHANRAPVIDNLNIQTAGPRGPVLLQVIPERPMHQRHVGNCRRADP